MDKISQKWQDTKANIISSKGRESLFLDISLLLTSPENYRVSNLYSTLLHNRDMMQGTASAVNVSQYKPILNSLLSLIQENKSAYSSNLYIWNDFPFSKSLRTKCYANFRVIFVEDQTFRQNVLFIRDLSAESVGS